MLLLRDGDTSSAVTFKGCIQPASPMDDSVFRLRTKPGVNDKRRFLFICPPELLSLEDLERQIEVQHNSLRYELLRCEPMYIGQELSHWEGVLRCLGRVS